MSKTVSDSSFCSKPLILQNRSFSVTLPEISATHIDYQFKQLGIDGCIQTFNAPRKLKVCKGKHKEDIRFLAVVYVDLQLTVKATIATEEEEVVSKIRVKKDSIQVIKERYFSKLTPDDLRLERQRVFERARVKSAAIVQPRSPKPSAEQSKQFNSRLLFARQFRETMAENKRVLSVFHQEKQTVQQSIDYIHQSLVSNRKVKERFWQHWRFLLSLVSMQLKVKSSLKRQRSFADCLPRKVVQIRHFLTGCSKLINNESKRVKNHILLAIKTAISVQSKVHAQDTSKLCADQLKQVFRTLVKLLLINQKVISVGVKCTLIRQQNRAVNAPIHCEIQTSQSETPRCSSPKIHFTSRSKHR